MELTRSLYQQTPYSYLFLTKEVVATYNYISYI